MQIGRSSGRGEVGVRLRILAYCLISAAVGLTLNLMPINLGSAADQYHLEPRQIGLLGSTLLWGFVLGGAACFWLLSRVNWRLLAALGLVVLALAFWSSHYAGSTSVLYAAWFIAGLGAGLPFSIAIVGLTSLGDPERMIGLKLMTEVLLGAALLFVVPTFVLARWHYAGAATVMSVAALLGLAAVPLIPPRAIAPPDAPGNQSSMKVSPIAWVALVSFIVYFAGQIALWAFLERFGRSVPVPAGEVGMVLASLKIAGAVTAGTVAVIGSRFGLRWPYLIGPGLIFAGLALLDNAAGVGGYAMGGLIWNIGFELTGVYQMAAIARLDKSGRLAALIPAGAGIGASLGPITGGILADWGGFVAVFAMTALCAALAMIVFLTLMSPRRGDAAAK